MSRTDSNEKPVCLRGYDFIARVYVYILRIDMFLMVMFLKKNVFYNTCKCREKLSPCMTFRFEN